MSIQKENWEYFSKHHPKIQKAYEEFGRSLHTEGGPLDEKQRWLIKVAISAAENHKLTLKLHVDKARKAGCTNEEIEHAIVLTASTAGFPTMMSALIAFRDTL